MSARKQLNLVSSVASKAESEADIGILAQMSEKPEIQKESYLVDGMFYDDQGTCDGAWSNASVGDIISVDDPHNSSAKAPEAFDDVLLELKAGDALSASKERGLASRERETA